MCGYVKPCDQQPRLSMSNPMRSKISGHIERALLSKSSDVGISALGIDSGRMTGNPEVISSPVGLVSRNAPAVSDQSLERSRLPVTNLLDEWIGDLPLIAEVVASQLAKITCPTGRQYIENRFQRQSASPGP